MNILRVAEKRERKADDPGLPFSDWEIWSERFENAPEAEICYPDPESTDTGLRQRFYGEVYLDGQQKRIIVRPRRNATAGEVKDMIVWAHNKRISGNFDVQMSALEVELADEPVKVAGLGACSPVVRCDKQGCDSFGQWHDEDLSTLDKCGTHISCDRSSPAYRCRLILDGGSWVLDVDLRAGFKGDPVRHGEELAFALLDVTSAARKFSEVP